MLTNYKRFKRKFVTLPTICKSLYVFCYKNADVA